MIYDCYKCGKEYSYKQYLEYKGFCECGARLQKSIKSITTKQNLTYSELQGGFLDIKSETIQIMPKQQTSSPIKVYFDNDEYFKQVNYLSPKSNTPMLTGLTNWFRQVNAKEGDTILFNHIDEDSIRISHKKK